MYDDNEENKKHDELITDETEEVIDGEIIEDEEVDEERSKEDKEDHIADVLSIISLILILIPTVVTMSIGIILLVFTRIRYPKNKFSKVIMIVVALIMIISMIIIYVMIMRCMNESISCVNECANMDCENCYDILAPGHAH